MKIVLARFNFMSLEFKAETKPRKTKLILWAGTHLLYVDLMWCGKDVPVVKIPLLMVAKLSGADSENPNVVCCGGVTVESFG